MVKIEMNWSRRRVLQCGTATAVISVAGFSPTAARERNADAALEQLLSQQLYATLIHSPQTLTSLGLDNGSLAWARHRLAAAGVDAERAARARLRVQRAELARFDRAPLSESAARSYDAALFKLEQLDALSELFGFGTTRGPYFTPYIVTQLTGAWYEIPSFLENEHPVASASDAEAYLTRLSAFASVLDGETERVAHDAATGVVPPDFILARSADAIEALADEPPRRSRLVVGLSERTDVAGLATYKDRAARLFVEEVAPALRRQAALLRRLGRDARHDAGCYALPDGEEIYRLGLLDNTTRPLSGGEVHRIGQDAVSAIHAQLDPLLQSLGYPDGSIGERLTSLRHDPAHAFADTDGGREAILGEVRALVADIERRLPEAFHDVPDTSLEVRRVPSEIEGGAPGGYYTAAPLDGSRPATYSINLSNPPSWPRWALAPLTHHEAVPGHHLQIGLLRESGEMPLHRRLLGFTAYSEGWALYAEKVARELGVYDGDPAGLVGQLQSQLFRAVRLVVDSGIHHERWSREEAIDYMVEHAGTTEATAVREIERYAVWPGNACAYAIGEMTISALRAEAEAALGPAFDLRDFHKVILSLGPVPLPVLEQAVRAYMTSAG